VSLENSLWFRYHPEATIHDLLVRIHECSDAAISDDEIFLYAELKRRLTKKELRYFIMKEAKIGNAEIAEALHVSSDALEGLGRKAYRKVRDGQLRKAAAPTREQMPLEDNPES